MIKTRIENKNAVHVRDFAVRFPVETESRPTSKKIDLILDSITEGCVSVDREWRFTSVNEESARWIGRSREYLVGKNIWSEFPEAVDSIFFGTFQEAMLARAAGQCDAYYAPQGRWLNARAHPCDDGLIIFFLDISDRKRKQDRLAYAGSHDPLTGLINRDACLQKIESALTSTGESRLGPMAVLLVDLDKFKEVNDAVGHTAGDHVLRLLAMRFKALSNGSRYCARLDGDAFLFVLYPCDAAQAQSFGQRLLDEIVKPFDVGGQHLVIGASVGIATVAEDEGTSGSDLVNQADTAMHAVKASGRLAVQLFDGAAAQASRRRLQLRNEMASAIASGEFRLHYQPQVRLLDNTLSGVEALVRWDHPTHGLLSPAAFLSIAEESPLILQLGAWVCDEACRQLAQWMASGHRLQIAINVSARQLIDPNFPQVLQQSVLKHGVHPGFIELEITESMLTQDLAMTAAMLTQLAGQGFRIALDDFGTGYSNLAYIQHLPIKILKIDRSFISDVDVNPRALDLIKGITALAKWMDMEVICEGIETVEQRSAVEKTQCHMIQGYLISRPLPSSELMEKFFDKTFD